MTTIKHEQLFEQIDTLPIDLKTKLVDKILASITPNDTTIDRLWIKEVKKRKNNIEMGKVALVSGEKVFENIAKKLNI